MPVETALDIANMLPATFTVPGLTEAQFVQLCQEFPDARVEYTAGGEVVIMPGTDFESGERGGEIVAQLRNWVREGGGGRFCGPEGSFLFPDGSRRSPDAAWCESARWEAAKRPDTRFPVFVPDFVIELRSPEQRAGTLREKMKEYIANGVRLGWLIDPIDRSVTIYRPSRDPEVLSNPSSVSGEGTITGFVLQLEPIFRS
ncbi:MAG: Uma2 family endonuclease [Bryobacterales bacterium]|nr:Uma2 family endonuclease [Bryobacterales bacterium]MBV9398487.1 Uma2 family endonuclease [Bryobacterales bacterium]